MQYVIYKTFISYLMSFVQTASYLQNTDLCPFQFLIKSTVGVFDQAFGHSLRASLVTGPSFSLYNSCLNSFILKITPGAGLAINPTDSTNI